MVLYVYEQEFESYEAKDLRQSEVGSLVPAFTDVAMLLLRCQISFDCISFKLMSGLVILILCFASTAQCLVEADGSLHLVELV